MELCSQDSKVRAYASKYSMQGISRARTTGCRFDGESEIGLHFLCITVIVIGPTMFFIHIMNLGIRVLGDNHPDASRLKKIQYESPICRTVFFVPDNVILTLSTELQQYNEFDYVW